MLYRTNGGNKGNQDKGWLSHWKPIADTKISTAIVASSKYFKAHETFDTEGKDMSNAYAQLHVIDNKIIYSQASLGKKQNTSKHLQLSKIILMSFQQKSIHLWKCV